MDGAILLFRDQSLADTALIRDYDIQETGGLQFAQTAGNAGMDPHQRRIAAIVHFLHQGAVAVKENCSPAHGVRNPACNSA